MLRLLGLLAERAHQMWHATHRVVGGRSRLDWCRRLLSGSFLLGRRLLSGSLLLGRRLLRSSLLSGRRLLGCRLSSSSMVALAPLVVQRLVVLRQEPALELRHSGGRNAPEARTEISSGSVAPCCRNERVACMLRLLGLLAERAHQMCHATHRV